MIKILSENGDLQVFEEVTGCSVPQVAEAVDASYHDVEVIAFASSCENFPNFPLEGLKTGAQSYRRA